MTKSKVLLIVMDGLGDRPINQFNNQTPLESARTPNMNYLVDKGIGGLVDAVGVGIRVGSDTSHLCLLGYEPTKHYTGRGPMEAAGLGIKLRDGDLSFRANFATVDKSHNIIDRRAGRIEDASVFEKALNSINVNGAEFLFKAGVSHRGALVMRPIKGTKLSDKVSENDPKEEKIKVKQVKPTDESKEAAETARMLNEYLEKAENLLQKHPTNKQRIKQKNQPANYLLVRGAGFTPSLEPFEQKHGLKGACVAGAAMYKGIASLAGLELIEAKGANGKADTNLNSKIDATLRALEKNDFVFLHIKATDNFGHDGDAIGKRAFIERVDDALRPITLLDNTIIVITSDHTTCCSYKNHTGDPVPILISGPGVRKDAVRKFGERDCAKGDLGRIRGLDVLSEAKNLAFYAKMYGT